MNMLLYVTSFKISSFPFAEKFEKKMLKFLRFRVNKTHFIVWKFWKDVEFLKSVGVNNSYSSYRC